MSKALNLVAICSQPHGLATDPIYLRGGVMRVSMRVLLVAALVAVLAALLGGCGDASTEDVATTTRDGAAGPGNRVAAFGEALDRLVNEDTITAEQEGGVLAATPRARRSERARDVSDTV